MNNARLVCLQVDEIPAGTTDGFFQRYIKVDPIISLLLLLGGIAGLTHAGS